MKITGAPDRPQSLPEPRRLDTTKRHSHFQQSPCRLSKRPFFSRSSLSSSDEIPEQQRKPKSEKAWLQNCQGLQQRKSCSKGQVSTIGSSLLASALTCTGGGNGGGGPFESFGGGGGRGDGSGSNSLFEIAAGSDQDE